VIARGYSDFAFRPDGRMVVLGSQRGTDGGRTALYLKRATGRGPMRKLTRPFDPHGGLGFDSEPDWSPDGRSVVFVRHYSGPSPPPGCAPGWCLRIYHRGRSRVLFAGPASLIGPEAAHPAWSVRNQITFEFNNRIWVIRPDGTGLRRVAWGGYPDWSPSGRRLVFQAWGGWITTSDLQGHHRRRLGSGLVAAYSPTGHRLVYNNNYFGLTIVGSRGQPRRRLWSYSREGSEVGITPDWQPLPRRKHR
jgi:Tol biopolymer transport system component